MNIIILAGATTSETDSFPSYLTEINHAPLIQILSELFLDVKDSKIFIPISSEDNEKYHIAGALEQIANSPNVVICNKTKGALLSALMCVDKIDFNQGLVVLNGNEYVNCDVVDVISKFNRSSFDAGLVCFDSIHPRYSHAVIRDDIVEEVAFEEVKGGKACTGLVWFRNTSDFFSAACTAVIKKSARDTNFYFNEVVNQMILDDKIVCAHQIDNQDYYPLKNASDTVSLRELLRQKQI